MLPYINKYFSKLALKLFFETFLKQTFNSRYVLILQKNSFEIIPKENI